MFPSVTCTFGVLVCGGQEVGRVSRPPVWTPGPRGSSCTVLPNGAIGGLAETEIRLDQIGPKRGGRSRCVFPSGYGHRDGNEQTWRGMLVRGQG